MNRKMIFNLIGKITLSEAFLLLLPAVVAFYYREECVIPLLISVGIALGIGLLLVLCFKPRDTVIYAREGFVIVAFAWILLSLIGALPFYLSGEIPSYIDAFFETVSGFTTTGASILTDVESMSRGLLFWRSFTHWVGGMGVLVFVMAIIPSATDRSIHLMRAEMPGPTIGKLSPRASDTAKILYIIYIVMTTVEVVLLKLGGMPLFESLLHSFGTAGTGGFGIKADSIGGYSPYIQWVIAIFMLIFGVNFNLYYLILLRKVRTVLKSTELWAYIGIVLATSGAITANIYNTYNGFSTSLRHAVFQVSSIITTTGYATVDFNKWPEFSKYILLMLMFIGGCAGSTAGGFKVSRVVMLVKQLRNETKRMLRPRSVSVVRFEEKTVDSLTLNGVNNYLTIYLLCLVVILLVLSFEKFGFLTNFSAAVSCFNNVGPGLELVGPASSYAAYSGISKLVLSFAMLFGRLEIFPMIIAFSRATWTRK